ncbi:DUF3021 domain-containing protein [Solibacillus sp. FSL W7-1464]|uniref:DUF3021 domain-containing protein n=1 Tax=Solibacillus sp. FSL W7-1464 TaxID=2921706 RepID=UPI0030F68AA8
MKGFLNRSIAGIFFGSFLTLVTIFLTVYFGEKEVLDSSVLVKNALGLIICGWFFSVTPLLFEMENFTLKMKTVLHFLCVVILYFIVAFVIGWIPFTIKGFFGMLCIFIVFYTVIWLGFYLYFRQQAAKLNEDLNKL